MKKNASNPQIKFFVVPGRSHFSVLGPANTILAAKILQDTGETTNLTLTDAELSGAKR
jgi:hypothetical protein